MIRKGIALVVMLLFIGICVTPSICGNIDKSMNIVTIDKFKQSPFQVSFTRPENGIYCFDRKLLPFPVPLIVCGYITVEAEIEPETEVDRIEIFINEGLQEVIDGPGPFDLTWEWGGPPFSKIMFRIQAYGLNATNASDEITIWRIFR